MNDQEFHEKFQPLQVPANFNADAAVTEQTLYALGQLGEATADEIVSKIKSLHGGDSSKLMISGIHEALAGWYERGLLGGTEENGDLKYNLHKITEANSGKVE